MSDHIDGPRVIGDPSIDLTDLFAFISPENPGRTVLAADVFPSAGTSAMFSNVVTHSIVVRRATIAGLGDAAKFKTGDEEYRFSYRFDTLEPGSDGKPIQRGTCTLPDAQVLRLVVNDEKGASTPDGAFRVFAGLRSDPFLLAWIMGPPLKKFQNLLQHDNVLSIVIEFDTRRVLDLSQGSLFGAIAETTPLPKPGGFVGHVNPLVSIGSADRNRPTCVSSRRAPPHISQAPHRQSNRLGCERREGRLIACGACRQRRDISRRFLVVRCFETDHRHQLP